MGIDKDYTNITDRQRLKALFLMLSTRIVGEYSYEIQTSLLEEKAEIILINQTYENSQLPSFVDLGNTTFIISLSTHSTSINQQVSNSIFYYIKR